MSAKKKTNGKKAAEPLGPMGSAVVDTTFHTTEFEAMPAVDDPVVCLIDSIDRAVTQLYALRRACGTSSDRTFRLRSQAVTDMVRRACDLIDGHRELAELGAAAKFALQSLRSAEANRGGSYGDSALGQAMRKLANAVDP